MDSGDASLTVHNSLSGEKLIEGNFLQLFHVHNYKYIPNKFSFKKSILLLKVNCKMSKFHENANPGFHEMI